MICMVCFVLTCLLVSLVGVLGFGFLVCLVSGCSLLLCWFCWFNVILRASVVYFLSGVACGRGCGWLLGLCGVSSETSILLWWFICLLSGLCVVWVVCYLVWIATLDSGCCVAYLGWFR